jgi:hypothetical protein
MVCFHFSHRFVLRPTKICYYLDDKEYELLAMVNLADIHTVARVDYKTRENVLCLVVFRPMVIIAGDI